MQNEMTRRDFVEWYRTAACRVVGQCSMDDNLDPDPVALLGLLIAELDRTAGDTGSPGTPRLSIPPSSPEAGGVSGANPDAARELVQRWRDYAHAESESVDDVYLSLCDDTGTFLSTPPAPAPDPSDFNKGQNHALRIVADLLGLKVATHQNVKAAIESRVLPEGVTREDVGWLLIVASTMRSALHYGIETMNADAGRYLVEAKRVLGGLDLDAMHRALTQPAAADKGEPE